MDDKDLEGYGDNGYKEDDVANVKFADDGNGNQLSIPRDGWIVPDEVIPNVVELNKIDRTELDNGQNGNNNVIERINMILIHHQVDILQIEHV